jgi:hypothetical protein
MGYQERRVELIAKRAAPHFAPGTQIQRGFIAQTGSASVRFLVLWPARAGW